MLRLILLSISVYAVHSLKILALFPHEGFSHFQVYSPLLKGLVQRGHEVTVLGRFPLKEKLPGYRDIVLTEEVATIPGDLESFKYSWINRWMTIFMLNHLSEVTCRKDFASAVVQNFLNSDENFDLLIVEAFNNDCFLSLVNRFSAPVIGMSTCPLPTWLNERIGNPSMPAYVPNIFQGYSDQIPFWGRLESLMLFMFEQVIYNNVMMDNGRDVAERYFGKESPSFMSLALNTSLILVNSHFTLSLPRPLVPGFVEVGGIHVGQVQKLPANLEKWINESTHGVIYFSLGSMIKGHTFPEEKRRQFLKAFARLPQRVLWKYENETMPEKPENLMIQKWMPQLDILCHPNVKAFISHGGLLGTTEAVHCGVPVMVMPQYGDQFTNAKALEANGGGVILHLHEATEEKVYDALTTILQPKFKKQAEELSARFKDRPMPPLETAIYWVEYVARHKGAHHMRTAAVGMPLYKYLLLDVIAFVLVLFAIAFLAFLYVARAVFRRLFQKSDSKKKTN